MDEVKKYWRDAVMKLLGWGTGSFVVVSGWTINESKKFELGPAAGSNHVPGDEIRAVGLIIFAVTFGIGWYLAVRWIYVTHLLEGVDATVLSWKPVRSYTLGVVTLLWVVTAALTLM